MAIAAMIIGATLHFGDFQPNIEQSDSASFAIRFAYAIFPAVFFIIAAGLLTFYSLDREEHKNIREAISSKKD